MASTSAAVILAVFVSAVGCDDDDDDGGGGEGGGRSGGGGTNRCLAHDNICEQGGAEAGCCFVLMLKKPRRNIFISADLFVSTRSNT